MAFIVDQNKFIILSLPRERFYKMYSVHSAHVLSDSRAAFFDVGRRYIGVIPNVYARLILKRAMTYLGDSRYTATYLYPKYRRIG